MDYRYNIVKNNDRVTSVTVFHKGEDYVATPAHPNFTLILNAVERGDSARKVIGLFDTYKTIGDRLKGVARRLFSKTPSGQPPSPDRPSERGRREVLRRIGEKVTVKGRTVHYDGEEMHGVLADTIARFASEGNEDWAPLALFLDKVMTNPNPHSREQLYDWLNHFSFQITDEGDFVAYKGVGRDFMSDRSGVGIVNGNRVRSRLDNSIGNVVEMPRNMVTHNPKVACARGLHVGTWEYASGFMQKTVRVVVNPRDVVSVPTDCNGQKLRVCKYKVIEEAKSQQDSRIFASASA